jgi:hypothetical protein
MTSISSRGQGELSQSSFRDEKDISVKINYNILLILKFDVQ